MIICKRWELCHIDRVLLKLADAGSLSQQSSTGMSVNILVSLWLMVHPGVTAGFAGMPSDSLLPAPRGWKCFLVGFHAQLGTSAKHRTSPEHLAEVSASGAVNLGGFGLACVLLGSGCCVGAAFWFVLCSVLWGLKLPQLCEVVQSLERELSPPGWWQTKGKSCFYNMGNKPPLNPERLLWFF